MDFIEQGMADGLSMLTGNVEDSKHALAMRIADELATLLNDWHSKPEFYDNELDAQIHKWYSDPPKVTPKYPYFSPSAAGADFRELYEKQIGSKKDKQRQRAYQGRWKRIGTAIGDVIQRDILFIEKHAEEILGYPSRFRFARTDKGEPMFEEFAMVCKEIHHRGKIFYLYGTCDGILEYITDDGEIVRVGLEIKSKQTTYAKTGGYSMKDAEDKHVDQTKVYSNMYDVDFYVVMYVNASKKAWDMTDEDEIKYPDLRTFGFYFDREDKEEPLNRFADILDAVEQRTPPLPDLSKWAFNSFKTAIAESLTDEEISFLRKQVEHVLRSSSANSTDKRSYASALEFIENTRKNSTKI